MTISHWQADGTQPHHCHLDYGERQMRRLDWVFWSDLHPKVV
ncbi:MAG: hypothetical protein RLP44_00815 [Aggregatilineales bacterium]